MEEVRGQRGVEATSTLEPLRANPVAPTLGDKRLAVKMASVSSPAISIEDAHFVLRHDRELTKALLRIPLPMIYFCCFVGMLFLHVPSESLYEQGSAVYSTLASSGGDTITTDSTIKFANIQSYEDVFDWLENTLAPSVFVTQDYNDNDLTLDKWGRIAYFNKVLGAVNYQVTRRTAHECDTQPFLQALYPQCYDPDVTNTDNVHISFDTNSTAAVAKIEKLRTNGTWIDYSIAKLLITIVTYNGELQGYAVTELTLEFQLGGSIVPSAYTTPALSNPYQAPEAIALDVLVIFFFLLAVAGQILKIRKHVHRGWHNLVTDVWTMIELLSSALVIAFYGIWISIVLLMFNRQFRENLEALVKSDQSWSDDTNGEKNQLILKAVTQSLLRIAKLTIALRLVATFAVFALGMRVLKRFRFHPRLSLLTRTMAYALHQFVSFFAVFIVVFMTFAVSGSVLFGDRVEEFSSLAIAMESCVNMLFGNFDTLSISDMYNPVGMIFYWVYMIVVSLVLLNMMLAIVLDAYAEVNREADKARGSLDASRVMCNGSYSVAVFFSDWKRDGSRGVCSRLWQWISWRKSGQKVRDLAYLAHTQDTATGIVVQLPRNKVVFRGRVRPAVLRDLTRIMLSYHGQNTEGDDSNMKCQEDTCEKERMLLTPSILMSMFDRAELTEQEAIETIQHLLEGIIRKDSEQIEHSEAGIEDGITPVQNAAQSGIPARNMENESQQSGGDGQHTELVARMAALEHKLDSLMTMMSGASFPAQIKAED